MERAARKAVPMVAPDKTQGAELAGKGVSSWGLYLPPWQ